MAVLVARGLTNQEISELLVLSKRTIESHVGNVLAKLGQSSRTQVALLVVEDARPAIRPAASSEVR